MNLKPNSGIDAADWQAGINLANLTPLPSFAIFKATESTNFRATTTVEFAKQAKSLGIPYGFYHFWRNVNVQQQVDIFLDQVRLAGGFERIPPVLDIEVDLTGQANNIKLWLDKVELATSLRPILYGNKNIFDKIATSSWFKNYDIWTASYPTYPDLWSWVPPLYSEKRGRREVMWQYASTYTYPAYPKIRIDTNIAIPEFLQEIGSITPPPTGDKMESWKVITPVLNIRTGSSTSFPIKTTAVLNDVLEGVLDTVSNWIHISKKNGVALDGWCSGGSTYVQKLPPASTADKMVIIITKDGVTTTYTSDGIITVS